MSILVRVLWLSTLLLAAPALGADGVVEINQACVEVGCTTADAPGFPVRIDRPGSYRLTSSLRYVSLVGGGSPPHLIEIAADDVTLDLNGFQIVCEIASVPAGNPCTSGGGGIYAISGEGTTVLNGTIRGVGGIGVRVRDRATLRDVRVIDAGGDGFHVEQGAHIEGCLAEGNGDDGFDLRVRSVVRDNRALSNQGSGFRVSAASVIAHNVASLNATYGFVFASSTAGDGLIEGNVATNNTARGMYVLGSWGMRSNVMDWNSGGDLYAPAVLHIDPSVCGSSFCP